MAETAGSMKIVVGVDGSKASEEALRQAEKLAGPLNASVEAVLCWDFPQLYEGYVTMRPEEFSEGAAKVLEETVTRAFPAERPRSVTTRLVQGNPKSSLIEASRDADLLVVGRRGHGVVAGQFFGSVSAACVAHAVCSVLVVHTPKSDGKG